MLSLAEDQHSVGDLGPDGQHEAFGEAVRARTPRRNLDHRDARVRQDRVERRRELPGSVADEEPIPGSAVAEVHDEVAGLLGGPGPVRMCGHAEDVEIAIADLDHEQHVEAAQWSAQSTWKKSTASMLVAWVCRNCRQLVSVCRTGAGGMRWRCRIRRIVEAPTRWPSLSNSPWILKYPQRGFSCAIRTTKAATTSSSGGRPVRFG